MITRSISTHRDALKSQSRVLSIAHNIENIISMFWPQTSQNSNNRRDIGVEADRYDLSENQLNLASD